MPIYEYECQNCGRRTEALQKLADPPLTTCEICQGTLKKLVSSPAFQFKGTGWYVTDYARKGSSEGKGESASEGGSEDSSKKTDASSSDAKGDKKGDKKGTKESASSSSSSGSSSGSGSSGD